MKNVSSRFLLENRGNIAFLFKGGMVKNGSSLLRAGEREGEGEEDSSAWHVFVSM